MSVASESQLKPPILNALRKATNLVIKVDPRDIVLIPQIRTRSPGGRLTITDGTPRASQQFTLASNSSTLKGITSTTGGVIATQDGSTAHKWFYTLTGRYDSEMEVNDHWIDGDITYRITAIQPFSGFEKVAVVEAFGKDPNYGS